MSSKVVGRPTAVHEAGHAVASWHVQKALGRDWCQFDRVFIRTAAESVTPYIDRRGREISCLGMMEGPDRYTPGIIPINLIPEEIRDLWRVNMEADVITNLAGPIAEARYRRQSIAGMYLGGGRSDFIKSRTSVQDFAPEQMASAMFAELQRRASKIVSMRWNSILALADELLVRRSLTGVEAIAVIEDTISCEWTHKYTAANSLHRCHRLAERSLHRSVRRLKLDARWRGD
jgi:hypothetical protein